MKMTIHVLSEKMIINYNNSCTKDDIAKHTQLLYVFMQ